MIFYHFYVVLLLICSPVLQHPVKTITLLVFKLKLYPWNSPNFGAVRLPFSRQITWKFCYPLIQYALLKPSP